MKFTLKRTTFTKNSTIGELSNNDGFICYTLEDIVRDGEKVPGTTAIPKGTYKVIIDFSHHFQKMMPHILDVPGFEGIRIHIGNSAKDTDGCILVGETKSTDFIGNSKEAYQHVLGLLNQEADNLLEIV